MHWYEIDPHPHDLWQWRDRVWFREYGEIKIDLWLHFFGRFRWTLSHTNTNIPTFLLQFCLLCLWLKTERYTVTMSSLAYINLCLCSLFIRANFFFALIVGNSWQATVVFFLYKRTLLQDLPRSWPFASSKLISQIPRGDEYEYIEYWILT